MKSDKTELLQVKANHIQMANKAHFKVMLII